MFTACKMHPWQDLLPGSDSGKTQFKQRGTPGKVLIQKGARKGDRYFAQFPRARFRGDFQKKSKGACKRES